MQARLSDDCEPGAHWQSGSRTTSFGQHCNHACGGGGHLVAAVNGHVGAVVDQRRAVRVIEEAPEHVIPDVVLHVERTCGGGVPDLRVISHALPTHLQHPSPSLRIGLYRHRLAPHWRLNLLSARRSAGHGVVHQANRGLASQAQAHRGLASRGRRSRGTGSGYVWPCPGPAEPRSVRG